jgi:type II secretory pathway component PulL
MRKPLMRDSLILFLPVSSDALLHWGVWSDDSLVENGKLDLVAAGGLSDKGLPVTLVVPGQNIRNFEHELPKMNRRERSKAVLFSIEDQLSAPLDTLHVALQDGAEQNTVSVISQDIMQEAITWAESVGLNVQRIVSDYEALDGVDYEAIALDDRVIIPGRLGHTLDREWYSGTAEPLDILAALTLMAPQTIEATNLMQGNFAPRSGIKGQTKTWFQLAGIAAALGLAFIFFETAQSHAIKAQADNIRAQTAAFYTQQTGQAAPSNPARAVTQAARQGQITPTQFLALSDISFRALQDFDDVSIERVSYQSNRDELQLRLVYPSFERADEVQRAMTEAGGQFIPGGVREQSGRFVGEAVLKLGGAS